MDFCEPSLPDRDSGHPDAPISWDDELQPNSHLFSQEENGLTIKDDCLASVRRLSSDNDSVVIFVSGVTRNDSGGFVRSGSGVFFSPTSCFNIAERVPQGYSSTREVAELYAVLLSLSQLEENYLQVKEIDDPDGISSLSTTSTSRRRQRYKGDARAQRLWRATASVTDQSQNIEKLEGTIPFSKVVIATENEQVIHALCFDACETSTQDAGPVASVIDVALTDNLSVTKGKETKNRTADIVRPIEHMSPKSKTHSQRDANQKSLLCSADQSEKDELVTDVRQAIARVEQFGASVQLWLVDLDSVADASRLAREGTFKLSRIASLYQSIFHEELYDSLLAGQIIPRSISGSPR
ncbi:hypothetical protein GLAREA_03099 [Glarea lozoyensis ATCC 20868]|uniref:Uncharacterized protein n=1 Tax=Glarea lozoyensis (strain ATCC 20868 / MF5171) TaxID=1116229 RepID=S3CN88_GLAL2|nr:uncharacterized protein GLAREA_03099 [Glarea lozoyensis ATCC 20868]EPE27185.1 hypothetical protein GLAREA_03099 [Glarea lozoyensis ATCC 20868]